MPPALVGSPGPVDDSSSPYSATYDFGDLPSGYLNTLLTNSGAQHLVTGGSIYLGSAVTTENDGKPSSTAALDGSASSIQDTLGWAYYHNGMYDAAIRHLENAVAKESTGLRKYHLGMAYLKQGDRERARRQDRLQWAAATWNALPFDTEAARTYGRVFAATKAAGRSSRASGGRRAA